ncbi:Lin0512 family protein [Aestuariivirga sp.]|uniref:Lin0512 family protein n=1 Tax=Aestuariivirga sp. TaxID=2650926 RepID=UPI003BA8F909
MALKRIILEMGHGNDMHGGDYTKAALRAVQDCIHHSSLPFLRTLDVEPKAMQVEVTIGVQKPEKVDTAAVAASLPHGEVTVKVVKGGLDILDDERGGASVVAMATVAVRLDLEAHLVRSGQADR